MQHLDPSRTSALTLACALRDRQVSCAEWTDATLRQIERLNPTIHAFVRVFPESARKQARRIDQSFRQGHEASWPIFLGVPNGIKDIDMMRGTLTQSGSRAFRYLWTPFDNEVTSRIRKAGFVLCGKLATSELAILPVTETDIHPPCRNPWNLEYTAGGSSGGSAAAVASGLLPIAHASDGGGSIRIPASFCHLFGIKVSRGLMPNFYKHFDPYGMSGVNAVSLDVEDSAAMLDAMLLRRYDPRHPPPGTFLAQTRIPPKRLRIRYSLQSSLSPTTPELQALVQKAASVLTDLGHEVSEAPMFEGDIQDFLPLWYVMTATIPILRESVLQPSTQWLRKMGRSITREEAFRRAKGLEAKILSWFGDTDVWLTPTVPVSPPKVGAWRSLSGEKAFQEAIPIGSFTALFNLSGQPAASLPLGLGQNNLPLGLQIVGQRGRDAMILSLAHQLQGALPWQERTIQHRQTMASSTSSVGGKGSVHREAPPPNPGKGLGAP